MNLSPTSLPRYCTFASTVLLETDCFEDESHVRQLATSGKRAVDADWIKALQYTTFEDAQTAAFHIKENIAQANIIILDGCPYDAVLLELDQLETAFNLHAASRVTVQGMSILST